MRHALLIVLLALVALPAHGQDVQLEVMATLGAPDDPGSPGATPSAYRQADGTTLVSSPEMGPDIFVYHSDGSFLRTVGGAGEGPGEYAGSVSFVHLPGDSVGVLDPRLGRLTILDPELRVVETVLLAGARYAAVRGDRILAAGTQAAGEDFATLWTVSRSSGDATPMKTVSPAEIQADGVFMHMNVFGTVGEDVWLSTMNVPVVSVWDGSAPPTRVFAVDHEPRLLEKLKAPSQMSAQERERAGIPSRVVGVGSAENGDVLVYAAIGQDIDPERGPADIGRMFETAVYRFHAGTGERMGVGTWPGVLTPLGPGLAFDTVETPIGDRRVRIIAVR